MPMPSSGPISFADLVATYGGAQPHAISEYYKGGAYVTNTPGNANVPTSGQIAMSQFFGASNIINHTVSVPNYNGNHSNGSVQVSRAATVSNGVGPFTYQWTFDFQPVNVNFVGSTTGSTVTISSTGNNTLKEPVVRCTVIDTGNSNYSASDDAVVSIQHGTPL